MVRKKNFLKFFLESEIISLLNYQGGRLQISTYSKPRSEILSIFLDTNSGIYQTHTLKPEDPLPELPYPFSIKHPKSFKIKFKKDPDNDFIKEKNQFFNFNLFGDIALLNKDFKEINFKMNFVEEKIQNSLEKNQISLVAISCDEETKDCYILMKSEGENQESFLTKCNFLTKKKDVWELRNIQKQGKIIKELTFKI